MKPPRLTWLDFLTNECILLPALVRKYRLVRRNRLHETGPRANPSNDVSIIRLFPNIIGIFNLYKLDLKRKYLSSIKHNNFGIVRYRINNMNAALI